MKLTKKKAGRAAHACIKGQSLAIPKQLSKFERYAVSLGLPLNNMEELLHSEKLRAYARRVRHTQFVPEILLHKWGITGEWSGGEIPDNQAARIDYESIRVVLDQETQPSTQ